MPVPGFQDLMLPMLRIAADGADHKIGDVVQALAGEFRLTEADRDERLSSGQQVIYNRTHWAATYLVKAGLLVRAVRGSVRITARGLEILRQHPSRVDIRLLSQFPEFESFRAKAAVVAEPVPGPVSEQDPEELLGRYIHRPATDGRSRPA